MVGKSGICEWACMAPHLYKRTNSSGSWMLCLSLGGGFWNETNEPGVGMGIKQRRVRVEISPGYSTLPNYGPDYAAIWLQT